MNKILIKFLNENKDNDYIYQRIIDTDEKYYRDILLNRFYDYIFKIYFVSYIEKSIRFSSYEIKNKKKKILNNEVYNLNEIDENFNEERINILIDESVDFLENISKEPNFKNISSNEDLIKALDSITDRQKLVIYMYFVEDKEEKQIAKELNVTKQSVNKVKIAALNRLKEYIKYELKSKAV